MGFTLFKATPAWGLPSYSAASIQVEAYLRLAEVPVAAEPCSSPGSSPTGQLPALESDDGLDIPSSLGNEFDAARSLIEALKGQKVDLDSRLSEAQQAQSLAFAALMQCRLEPASLYTTWCEWESFSKYVRPVAGADLPVPLNYITTWSQRKAQMRSLAHVTQEEIYAQATDCYTALAAQLSAVEGDYLLGSRPSSADALLYGHLALHLRAPVSSPELQRAVAHDALRAYAERVAQIFETPLPPPPQPSTSPEWTQRAEAASSSRPKSAKRMSKKDREHQWRNWVWLGGAAAIVSAYIVFSGQVIEFDYGYEDEDEEGDV